MSPPAALPRLVQLVEAREPDAEHVGGPERGDASLISRRPQRLRSVSDSTRRIVASRSSAKTRQEISAARVLPVPVGPHARKPSHPEGRYLRRWCLATMSERRGPHQSTQGFGRQHRQGDVEGLGHSRPVRLAPASAMPAAVATTAPRSLRQVISLRSRRRRRAFRMVRSGRSVKSRMRGEVAPRSPASTTALSTAASVTLPASLDRSARVTRDRFRVCRGSGPSNGHYEPYG